MSLTTQFEAVELRLLQHWSPQQIALDLRRSLPDNPDLRVSHETIYHKLCTLLRSHLMKEMLSYIRHGMTNSLPLDARQGLSAVIQIMLLNASEGFRTAYGPGDKPWQYTQMAVSLTTPEEAREILFLEGIFGQTAQL